ncbi:Uncharacterised protein [Bordetella pertussis]|nr:Uncharacterised protein [Bordetella pertussis]
MALSIWPELIRSPDFGVSPTPSIPGMVPTVWRRMKSVAPGKRLTVSFDAWNWS